MDSDLKQERCGGKTDWLVTAINTFNLLQMWQNGTGAGDVNTIRANSPPVAKATQVNHAKITKTDSKTQLFYSFLKYS